MRCSLTCLLLLWVINFKNIAHQNVIGVGPGPVFTKILRIFLRITLKSKKNSLLRIFLFLE